MEHESIRKKEGRVRRVKKEGGKREWGEEEERGGRDKVRKRGWEEGGRRKGGRCGRVQEERRKRGAGGGERKDVM